MSSDVACFILTYRWFFLSKTEMELRLRSQCQKLRVVEKKNLNGAHLMIQKSSSIPMCLAVRVYYPEDVKLLDEQLSKATKPSNAKDIDSILELLHGGEWKPSDKQAVEHDVDGLKGFRDKNQSTVVICVLPEGYMTYLDRPVSHCTGCQANTMRWQILSNSTSVFAGVLGQLCSTHHGQWRVSKWQSEYLCRVHKLKSNFHSSHIAFCCIRLPGSRLFPIEPRYLVP